MPGRIKGKSKMGIRAECRNSKSLRVTEGENFHRCYEMSKNPIRIFFATIKSCKSTNTREEMFSSEEKLPVAVLDIGNFSQ